MTVTVTLARLVERLQRILQREAELKARGVAILKPKRSSARKAGRH